LKIRLKLHGMLGFISSSKYGKDTEVDFMGNTVEDLVNHLLSRMKSEEKCLLLNEQGEILPDLLVFLNGKFIPAPDQLSHSLATSDLVELAILSE